MNGWSKGVVNSTILSSGWQESRFFSTTMFQESCMQGWIQSRPVEIIYMIICGYIIYFGPHDNLSHLSFYPPKATKWTPAISQLTSSYLHLPMNKLLFGRKERKMVELCACMSSDSASELAELLCWCMDTVFQPA